MMLIEYLLLDGSFVVETVLDPSLQRYILKVNG